MKKGSLKFIPVGGLANRMRAIASAYQLCKEVDSMLHILWFQDWALSAPFNSIFEQTPLLNISEASGMDFLLYDRARRRNFHIPALPQWLLFERRINEIEVSPLKEQGFDFAEWARGHRCHMSCYQSFGSFPNTLYKQLFHPVSEVISQVDRYCSQFSEHTIGLHIRRTDNIDSIKFSPTSLFINKVKEEIDLHADTRVFLATDSEEVKQELLEQFGFRVITSKKSASRDSIEGIRGGLTDLWTLSATHKIYGSTGSSYSCMASSIGGKPLEILQTTN